VFLLSTTTLLVLYIPKVKMSTNRSMIAISYYDFANHKFYKKTIQIIKLWSKPRQISVPFNTCDSISKLFQWHSNNVESECTFLMCKLWVRNWIAGRWEHESLVTNLRRATNTTFTRQ